MILCFVKSLLAYKNLKRRAIKQEPYPMNSVLSIFVGVNIYVLILT